MVCSISSRLSRSFSIAPSSKPIDTPGPPRSFSLIAACTSSVDSDSSATTSSSDSRDCAINADHFLLTFVRTSSKSRSGGILLAQAFADRSIYVERALEVNNRRTRLYRKVTQLLATLFVAVLSQSLEVVVEHSRMTYQTHLLRVSDCARSDQSATPCADHMVCGPGVAVRLRIYIAHVFSSKQISFHLMNSPQYQ